MKTAPYLYRRFANSIAAEVTFEAGTELVTRQGGILEYDASPRAKAPAKPKPVRKPKSRVFVADLPLTNQPPAPPLPVPVALVGGHDSGPALTPRQVERLETSEQLGLLNADGRRNLADWREREARKALRRKVKAVSRG